MGCLLRGTVRNGRACCAPGQWPRRRCPEGELPLQQYLQYLTTTSCQQYLQYLQYLQYTSAVSAVYTSSICSIPTAVSAVYRLQYLQYHDTDCSICSIPTAVYGSICSMVHSPPACIWREGSPMMGLGPRAIPGHSKCHLERFYPTFLAIEKNGSWHQRIQMDGMPFTAAICCSSHFRLCFRAVVIGSNWSGT